MSYNCSCNTATRAPYSQLTAEYAQ